MKSEKCKTKTQNLKLNRNLAIDIGCLLQRRRSTVAIAESCTGGLIAHRITNVPGSSDYFLMGMIAYSHTAKLKMLRIPARLLRRYGAVSREVASAMADGIRHLARSTIGLGITGIAGPGGGTPTKPVGLVYVACAAPRHHTVRAFQFGGHRLAVKEQASEAALTMLRSALRQGRA